MANKCSPCISVISDSFSLIAKTSASLLGNDVLKSVVLLHDLPLHTHIHIRAKFIMRNKIQPKMMTYNKKLSRITLTFIGKGGHTGHKSQVPRWSISTTVNS